MSNANILEEIEHLKTMISDINLNSKEVFTFEEARRFLDVSASYLYKLTSQQGIPFYKPQGKRVYFSRKELIEWLLRNRNLTRTEIELKANNYLLNNLGK
jgi:excisionase family DNA binding protein